MRRELAVVLLSTAAAQLALATRPFHLDEPAFLAVAHNILRQPLHPLSFMFNWYGVLQPEAQINTNPLGFPYLLAAALKLTGGGEALMRAVLLPFDLAAAAALYFLARRFLDRPLWPTLIVLLCPAYIINMSQLIPEKVMAPFAFGGLYALVRGFDDDDPRWQRLAAALIGASLLFKYSAVFLFVPALGYGLMRRAPLRRLAELFAIAMLPLAAYVVADLLLGHIMTTSAWDAIRPAMLHWWVRGGHTARSLLSFCGWAGLATAVWPCLFMAKGERRLLAACVVVGAAVFLPVFDLNPARLIDRAQGALVSGATLYGFARLARERGRGWALWVSWAAGTVIVLALYHSIVTRLVAFLIPPVLFSLAETFEKRCEPRRLERTYAATLAAVVVLSAALAGADYRYAASQKDIAELAASRYIAAGRKVWFTGHWGLQYYLERAGGTGLDYARGGWGVTRPGDVVVSPVINGDVLPSRPSRGLLSNVELFQADYPLPVRLQGVPPSQCGFYSSNQGFLPFCLTTAPVEEFRVIERL